MTTANDTNSPPPPPLPPPEAPRPRLTRSSDDKVLSGLCGGLGRYFGVDPVIFRIAFVVVSLAGGTGVLLYLLGWALVPSDSTGVPAVRAAGRGRGEQVVAAVLVGVGVVVLLDEVFDGPDPGLPVGVALVVLGALVLWGQRQREVPPWPSGPPGPVPSDVSSAPPAPPPPAPGAGEPPAPGVEASSRTPEAGAPTAPTAPLPADVASPAHGADRGAGPTAAPERPASALVPVTLSLVALLAGGLAILDAAGVADVSLVVGLSLVLLLVGGALLVGARWGRGRVLIPVGLVLSLALVTVALVDVPLRGGLGERTYRPLTLAELDTPYRLAAGDLTLDLAALELGGTSGRVVASVGAGRVVVIVPADAAVVVDGEVAVGEVRVLGGRDGGVGVDRRVVDAGREGGGRLVLELRVGVGELEVRRAAA